MAREGVVLRELEGDANRPHDARLPRDVMTLLDDAGIALEEIDVYSVATGPGSFTGLRIGIATMQGLAFAASKPLIGVSAFDALARAVAEAASRTGRSRIATWIDAWRGEVYAAVYEGGRETVPPTVELPAALLRSLRGAPAMFAGDAAGLYRAEIEGVLGAEALIAEPPLPLLAGTIALMATEMRNAGCAPAPHAIRPVYVRRPDAVLARDARPVR